jgi:hypothetical protein
MYKHTYPKEGLVDLVIRQDSTYCVNLHNWIGVANQEAAEERKDSPIGFNTSKTDIHRDPHFLIEAWNV